MMTADFDDLASTHAHCGRRRRARRRPLADRRRRQRSARVLPQPGDGGPGAAHAPLRHPRLRDVGAHRMRLRRAGARHGAEADPPRLRRPRARRRLRFDDQPDRASAASACSPRFRTDNDTPERASRPFDATRNGFLLGEGAGFLVLEEWDARAGARRADLRRARRRRQFAVVSYRITDSPPDGDGPIQAMRQALADAGATPGRHRLRQRARHVDAR